MVGEVVILIIKEDIVIGNNKTVADGMLKDIIVVSYGMDVLILLIIVNML